MTQPQVKDATAKPEVLGEWFTATGNRLTLMPRRSMGYVSIWLNHHGKPVMYTLGNILQNRYYLARLNYKGTEYQGRHTPLVSQKLFDRGQDVLRQNNAGTRKRVHDHPLKGILWCRHCDTRFYLDTVKNRRGIAYSYFLCSGRAGKRCPTPRIPVAEMEAEVAAHYATLRVPPALAATLRESLGSMFEMKQQFNDDIPRVADGRAEADGDQAGSPVGAGRRS